MWGRVKPLSKPKCAEYKLAENEHIKKLIPTALNAIWLYNKVIPIEPKLRWMINIHPKGTIFFAPQNVCPSCTKYTFGEI